MHSSGLSDLNAIVIVAKHRSFRAAAAELGMSPSALSRIVAGFEQRLGVRIFNRTTRSVSLSEAGERLLAHLQPALRGIDEALDAVNDLRDSPRGTLKIDVAESGARLLMRPIFVEFLRRHPDMRIDLVTEGRRTDIVAAGVDIGIRLAGSIPQDMVSVRCSPDHAFVVVGSPGYFADRTEPAAPADLSSHVCIGRRFPSGAVHAWEFERDGQVEVVDVKGRFVVDSHPLMVEAAREGLGLAYVSEWFAAEDLKADRLVQVLADWTPKRPGLCLYYPRNKYVGAGMRAFIDFVHETVRRWAAAGNAGSA